MRIDRITIAVENMDAMVQFYNAVFDTRLMAVGPQNIPEFYKGRLGEVDLLFCPNSVVEVVAEKNRQQFRFVVDDLEAILVKVGQAGGRTLDDSIRNGTLKVCGVEDPDNNTIEFVQYPGDAQS
jgi:catechol 2,3-dioxygenase-like lactoylglutathione lyase family enzyme